MSLLISDTPRLRSSVSIAERKPNTGGKRIKAAIRSMAPYVRPVLLAALGIQFCFWTNLPYCVGVEGDAAWHAGLSQLCMRHAQAGVDYIFTYGPLSFIECRAFFPDLYWPQFFGKIAFNAIGGAVVALLAWRMRPTWIGYAFMLVACLIPLGYEGCYETAIVGSGLLLLRDSRRQLAGLVLAAAVFAAFSLMKLTYVQLSIPVLAVLSFVIWRQGRRWRAVAPLPLFAGFFLVGWTLLGQRLENIPAFFRGAADLISGYSEAASMAGPRKDIVRALAILLLYAAAVATCGVRAIIRPQMIGGLAILAFGMFVSWKHAFVRHDLHALFFFNSAMLLPFLMLEVMQSERCVALRRVLVGVAFGLTLYGFHDVASRAPGLFPSPELVVQTTRAQAAQALFPASNYASLMNQWTQKQREWDLPLIRERVKDQTVDMMGSEQGVLFLNNLNWSPRPIFQSYAAYAPSLIAANAEHFRGDRAPKYVLWNQSTIDARFPTLDDCTALFEILWNYTPVLTERKWLLFERMPANEAARPSGNVVLEKHIELGETVSLEQLSGKYQTAVIEIDYSTWGKIQKVAYRPDFIYVKVRLADGAERVYRLIPGMTRQEFLLNPLCEGTAGFIEMYQDQPGKRIVSLALDTQGHDAAFAETVKLTIREYAALTRGTVVKEVIHQYNESANRAEFPMLKSPPFSIKLPGASTEIEDGKPVLRSHAEGELRYRLSRQHRRIKGKCGIQRGAYEGPGETDGVLFVVEHVSTDGRRTPLFQRELDPKARPGDRGDQFFEIELPDRAEGTAILRTTNSPAHHVAWDWAYWTELELCE